MRKTKFNPCNRIVPVDYLPYLSRLRERYKDKGITKDENIIMMAREEFGFSRCMARHNVVRMACQIIDNVEFIPNLKKRSKKAYKQRKKDAFFGSPEWKQLRYIALKNANGCCQCCGAKSSMTLQLHVDHIKPRSRYPELALDINNLQVLCQSCNEGKSAWDDTDWRPSE